MNIVKEWQYRLQQVNQTISDYREILVNNELTHDMKIFCLGEIERKTKYKNLIEETLRRLEG